MVGWVQTVFEDVAMGRPIATRWKRPLVKARPAKVKGLDLLVNWDSGWPSGCSYATETSHGSRCMCESVLACVDARLGPPWCGPPPRKAEQPSLRGGDGAGAVEPEGI